MLNWNQLPSLSALRAFEAAARHGSLSAAARELNVTHAAIAQHVRSLEAHLSETLTFRQGRGIGVTDAGQQLAESLSAGFGLISDGVEALRDRQCARPLNLSVTPSFAEHWLMPRIGDFWARHPGVSVNINPDIAVVDLKRDGFDLAIRYGDGNWPGVEATVLLPGEFWVVAHPDLVTEPEIGSLQDLLALPWLLETQMTETRRLLEADGLDLSEVDLTDLNTNSLVLSAVVAGLGIAVQPKSLVAREVEQGRLRLLWTLNPEKTAYHLLSLPGRATPGLKAFQAWLRDQAKEA